MSRFFSSITLLALANATELTAGSITTSSGNVRTQGNQVITGSGARAEAKVDQRGSVVRLGSNTAAQVGDRGDVSLSKGVVLISSGDGFLRRPAVQISTPQGDVTVRGSAIVAALPDGSVKMTCLEGSVRGDLGGQNMALNPGNLIVQRQEGTRDAVQVNLGALTTSSALLDSGSFKPLPAATEIHQEVVQQSQSLGATLQVSRTDSNAAPAENQTIEIKKDGPGLLARIFGAGGTHAVIATAGENVTPSAAATVNAAGLIKSGAGTLPMANAGALVMTVSGSNVIATQRTEMATSASLTSVTHTLAAVPSNFGSPVPGNVVTGVVLTVPAPTGLTISGTMTGPVGNAPGSILIRNTIGFPTASQTAQQHLSGNLNIVGPGGTPLTPINNNGVLTFQPLTPANTGGVLTIQPVGGIISTQNISDGGSAPARAGGTP